MLVENYIQHASFDTTPAELTIKYLPSGSIYYEVKDAETEEVIVPFGSGSKISCDSTGNFFRFKWTDYKQKEIIVLVLKVVSGSGTTDEQIKFL